MQELLQRQALNRELLEKASDLRRALAESLDAEKVREPSHVTVHSSDGVCRSTLM